jgi:hypothetical protein
MEVKEVLEKFPALTYKLIPDVGLYFEGPFHVVDQSGIFEYTFQLKIVWLDPYRYPLVFEMGGYIPRTIDFHVYPQTGNLCIKGTPEEIWECRDGLPLLKFLEGTLKNLLIHHIFRKKEGYFLQERSHGKLGALESLCDLLKIRNQSQLPNILKIYLKNAKIPSEKRCACNSGKIFRNCCAERWKKLSIFPSEYLEQFLA